MGCVLSWSCPVVASCRLVRQYGFLIPANSFDRLTFPEAAAISGCRLDRYQVWAVCVSA